MSADVGVFRITRTPTLGVVAGFLDDETTWKESEADCLIDA